MTYVHPKRSEKKAAITTAQKHMKVFDYLLFEFA